MSILDLSKTDLEKRAAQNRRIFCEYPWLWAFKQRWHLEEQVLTISRTTKDTFFFAGYVSSYPLIRCVIVHYQYGSLEGCEIVNPKDKVCSWAMLILQQCPKDFLGIDSLAIVYDDEEIVIIRPPRWKNLGKIIKLAS